MKDNAVRNSHQVFGLDGMPVRHISAKSLSQNTATFLLLAALGEKTLKDSTGKTETEIRSSNGAPRKKRYLSKSIQIQRVAVM